METVNETIKPKEETQFNLRQAGTAAIKRLFDILFSLLGILVLWPFFLYVAIRIKREDPGPVFYRGWRVGKGGKNFKILKFRTMYERPESYNGARVTANGDARITPLGRWLRDTKLNELPQLWNVLLGEMSIVGPRPEDPEIFQSLPQEYQAEISTIRPGITSPTSVAYHDEEHMLTPETVMGDYQSLLPDKLRMDQLYVRHHSLISDLDTIFWTFIIMIPRLGKNRIQEGWLFGGPIARFMRHYFSWFLIDFLVALAGISLVGLGWRLVKPLDMGFGPALILAIILSFSFGFSNTVLGLKSVSWQRAAASDVFKLIFSCVLVAGFYITFQLIYPIMPGLTPSFIIAITLVVTAGFVMVRYRGRLLTGLATRWVNYRRGTYGVGERVLIIGSGAMGEFAAWMLKSTDFRPFYQVIGYVDDDPQKQGMRFDGIKVLGTVADITHLVSQHNIGLLFFAIHKLKAHDKERILSCCKKTNLPIVIVPDVVEKVRGMIVEQVQSVKD